MQNKLEHAVALYMRKPNAPGQKSTEGVSKLTIHMTECSEVKLTVAFGACEKIRK